MNTLSLPSKKELFLLTLPQLGLMLCHLFISMTDIWATGQISFTIQAALGLMAQFFIFLMLIVSIASSGSLSTISQALGANLPDRANRYAFLVFLIAFISGTLVAILSIIFFPLVLKFMHVDTELEPILKTFFLAYSLQLPFYYCMTVMNSIFRAHKILRLPLITLIFVATLNFLGTLGFGLGYFGLPNYGYHGIAWSTFFANLCGFSLNLYAVIKNGIFSRRSFIPLKWVKKALPYLFKIGVPSSLSQFSGYFGFIIILSLLSALPNDSVLVLAAVTLGIRIESIILFPISALMLSAAIVSGHLLGKKDMLTLSLFAKKIGLFTVLIVTVLAGILFLLKNPIIRFLSVDTQMLKETGYYLMFACTALPLKAYSMIIGSIFASVGATRLSFYITSISTWVILIPLAYILTNFYDFAETGIYVSMLIAQVFIALAYFILSHQEKWLQYGMRKNKK